MDGGQPETAATGETLEGGALLGFGQALEFDLDDGFGLVGRRDNLVVARQPPAMRGGEPESWKGVPRGRGRLLPFHVELHDYIVQQRRAPGRGFRT